MSFPDSTARAGADWTAEQILAWMDSFRELVLLSREGAAKERSSYDAIRACDPSRRVEARPGDPATGRVIP